MSKFLILMALSSISESPEAGTRDCKYEVHYLPNTSGVRKCSGRNPMPITRGDSAQERESPQQLQRPGDGKLRIAADHSADHSVLDQDLEALGQPGRELSPSLHFLEIVRCRASLT